MTLHLAEAWNAVSTSPVLGVALTLAAYQLARTLWLRAGNQPGVDPVLIAIVLVGLVLWVTGIDYDTYMRGGSVTRCCSVRRRSRWPGRCTSRWRWYAGPWSRSSSASPWGRRWRQPGGQHRSSSRRAVGVASPGIGTAQTIQESRTEGAFSGLAMALTAPATSIWLPVLVPLLT